MTRYLHLGGLVAVGFDKSGEYLLVVSHSGRGVFATRNWARVARDAELAYPEHGIAVGIGPIQGQLVPVTEFNSESGMTRVVRSDGLIFLDCESCGIAITDCET